MQITIRGDMSMAQLRQAFFEKLLELESEFGVKYSKGATLYVNPTDEFGEEVVPRNQCGRVVTKMLSNGPYRSAADDFQI